MCPDSHGEDGSTRAERRVWLHSVTVCAVVYRHLWGLTSTCAKYLPRGCAGQRALDSGAVSAYKLILSESEVRMLESFASPNRRLTIVLLAMGIVILAAGCIVGISDNPPGILLAYAGLVVIVTALVHPWRTPRKYRYLAYASIFGVLLFAVLHNVFDALSGQGTGMVARYLLQPLDAAAFLLAVFVCPAGFLVGLSGAVIALVRNRRQPPAPAA